MKCTKEQFDEYLISLEVDPQAFWNNFRNCDTTHTHETPEDLFRKRQEAAGVIDSAFIWDRTPEGQVYWDQAQDRAKRNPFVEHPPKPFISCCAWNGHPIYCKCAG